MEASLKDDGIEDPIVVWIEICEDGSWAIKCQDACCEWCVNSGMGVDELYSYAKMLKKKT